MSVGNLPAKSAAANKKALCQVPGVSQAEVDRAGKKASVDYDPAVNTKDLMAKAVEDAGYTVPA